jgi:hypothetical protein
LRADAEIDRDFTAAGWQDLRMLIVDPWDWLDENGDIPTGNPPGETSLRFFVSSSMEAGLSRRTRRKR